jgi:hypothetical protein
MNSTVTKRSVETPDKVRRFDKGGVDTVKARGLDDRLHRLGPLPLAIAPGHDA